MPEVSKTIEASRFASTHPGGEANGVVKIESNRSYNKTLLEVTEQGYDKSVYLTSEQVFEAIEALAMAAGLETITDKDGRATITPPMPSWVEERRNQLANEYFSKCYDALSMARSQDLVTRLAEAEYKIKKMEEGK